MLTNIVNALNWQALVAETLKRRKEEGWTQKYHAMLAGVSIPTMIAFEKGETTISLAKALDILKIVGLVARPTILKNKVELFSEKSENRWFELKNSLPANSQARHEHGVCLYSYQITGEIKSYNYTKFLKLLKEASSIKYSPWAPFEIFDSAELVPYNHQEYVECWLKDNVFTRPDNTDFWRASLQGGFHLHRCYWEDTIDSSEPRKIFDLSFHIMRTAEIILHAARLAKLIVVHPNNSTIQFLTTHTKLEGRILKYSDTLMFETKICQQATLLNNIEFNVGEINDTKESLDNLVNIVHKLLANLCSHFAFFDLPRQLVADKLAKMFDKKLLGFAAS